MKKFSFNLQSLLDHRISIEEMRLMELARLRMEEDAQRARLSALRASQRASWQALLDLSASMADSAALAHAAEHCEAMGDDVRLGELNVQAACRNMELKLAEAIEASRERKLIEQLRDKRRREHELEQMRIEQNELDDMTTIRYARDRQ